MRLTQTPGTASSPRLPSPGGPFAQQMCPAREKGARGAPPAFFPLVGKFAAWRDIEYMSFLNQGS